MTKNRGKEERAAAGGLLITVGLAAIATLIAVAVGAAEIPPRIWVFGGVGLLACGAGVRMGGWPLIIQAAKEFFRPELPSGRIR